MAKSFFCIDLSKYRLSIEYKNSLPPITFPWTPIYYAQITHSMRYMNVHMAKYHILEFFAYDL